MTGNERVEDDVSDHQPTFEAGPPLAPASAPQARHDEISLDNAAKPRATPAHSVVTDDSGVSRAPADEFAPADTTWIPTNTEKSPTTEQPSPALVAGDETPSAQEERTTA